MQISLIYFWVESHEITINLVHTNRDLGYEICTAAFEVLPLRFVWILEFFILLFLQYDA